MIKLIDIIQEGKQVGTLYHFTTYKNMLGIIKSGYRLKNPKSRHTYVSFTRNPNLILDYPPIDVRIAVDGTALSNKYKIEPFVDLEFGYGRTQMDDYSQAEERISLDKHPRGVNIAPYIKEIAIEDVYERPEVQVYPELLEEYEALIAYLDENRIPYKMKSFYNKGKYGYDKAN